jgi:hypothetical protein
MWLMFFIVFTICSDFVLPQIIFENQIILSLISPKAEQISSYHYLVLIYFIYTARKYYTVRGGLGSIGLCGISYKKFFKIPKRPLFVTFCMVDYKSLAAIAALPQWPVRPCIQYKVHPDKI